VGVLNSRNVGVVQPETHAAFAMKVFGLLSSGFRQFAFPLTTFLVRGHVVNRLILLESAEEAFLAQHSDCNFTFRLRLYLFHLMIDCERT
jgi:hypothetical protein